MIKTQAYRLSATACVLLPLPTVYVASYVALLSPAQPFVEPTKGNYLLRRAGYRFGGDLAKFLISPLHEIDVWLRPTFWCDLTEKGKRWAGEPG